MALAAVNLTIGTAFANGSYGVTVKGGSGPDFATVTTNVATLVADAASPTQAHVTTLNTNYTALAAAINGDVTLIWNTTTITHRNQMRHALLALIKAIEGGYGGLAE